METTSSSVTDPALPAAVAADPATDVAVLLDRAREQLAALNVASLTAAGRSRALAAVDRTMGSLTEARGRLLAAVQESGDWQTGADRDAATWRGRTAGIGQKAARTEMAQATTLQALPTVARGVQDGTVSPAHLDALARVTPRTTGAAREALAAADAQAELVALAQRLDADAYGKAVARKVAEAEPSSVDRDHAAQRAGRSVVLTDTAGGTRIAGVLDRMAGHRLRLALEALSPRPTVDDDRTHEQRWADALTTMAESVLASPATAPGAAVRPHVSFVLTDEAWIDLKTHAAARAAGNVLAIEDTPRIPVTLEDGTPVPTTEIGRALCDCELTRIVVDAQSQPVDVGRTKRLYDGPLRRAIIARDRTCSWPGCAQHARWCEIHHIRWWDRDHAETSVDNGVLLCRFHHQRVHDHDLAITRHAVAAGGAASNGIVPIRYEFRRPDGRLFVPPFGNERHPPPPDEYLDRGSVTWIDPCASTSPGAETGRAPDGTQRSPVRDGGGSAMRAPDGEPAMRPPDGGPALPARDGGSAPPARDGGPGPPAQVGGRSTWRARDDAGDIELLC